jgi:iron complex outermembrane recepter protein
MTYFLFRKHWLWAAIPLLLTSPIITAAEAETENTSTQTSPVDVFELPEIEVVSTTPVGSSGLKLKKISGNVQSIEDETLNRHEATSLPDFMNRQMQSVNINDTQNNPYQPDITYRGFSASPVLGAPIGVSVYQDGVRVNEAFGDTINWDLIPQIAISSMEMMPGSNPLFGLNTLGGALSLRTKSGRSHPGFNAQASGGSYGRQNYQAEVGGSHDQFDWYFAGNIFDDQGWRPYSPSSVNQSFGKIGWENDKTDLDLSFTFADNKLQGVGPVPQDALQQNWSAIYSAPDITKNTLYFFNLKGNHWLTDQLKLSGTTYNRNNNSYSLNSNTGDTGGNCDTYADCLAGGFSPATFQAARAKQNGTGINLQLTSDYKVFKHENQFVLGGGYNYAKTGYTIGTQNADFTPTFYEVANEPLTTTVNINGENTYSNVFATDTFSVFDWLHLNASTNWMQAHVQTLDKMGDALNGNNTFQRLNPSAGLTFNPFDALSLKTPLQEFTTYFNYNEGFRAPTPVELTCADPNAPCTLPNSFLSDPPLKPVVSHTLETGLRGKFSAALKWNLSFYETINTNDILFLNVDTTRGYFSNVGKTKRQGIELGLSGLALDSLNWYMSYGFVDATYQSNAQLFNGLGAESVIAGNKIPSIPANTLKFGSEYEVFHNFFFGGDLQYVSSQYARGDDTNSNPQIPDYAIVNLNTRYVINKNIELFAMGKNIFDNHYVSFSQLGQNFFNNNPTQFQGPGAPATGYAGIRVHWN